MKQLLRYSDSRGRSILATSQEAAKRFFDRELKDHESAIYAGRVFVKPSNLHRIDRGIYKEVAP